MCMNCFECIKKHFQFFWSYNHHFTPFKSFYSFLVSVTVMDTADGYRVTILLVHIQVGQWHECVCLIVSNMLCHDSPVCSTCISIIIVSHSSPLPSTQSQPSNSNPKCCCYTGATHVDIYIVHCIMVFSFTYNVILSSVWWLLYLILVLDRIVATTQCSANMIAAKRWDLSRRSYPTAHSWILYYLATPD